MHNDDVKITDSDKMRLHYRKRSAKAKGDPFKAQPTHEQKDITFATAAEKTAYKNVVEHNSLDKTVYVGKKKQGEKTIIIDTACEQKRNRFENFEKLGTIVMLIAVFILVVCVVSSFFSASNSGSKIIDSVLGNRNISDDGNYIFGTFEGYLTIGDSFDKAVDILGLPTPGDEGQYFYENSYILVKNDIIIGYHKDKNDYFPVTVGYKDPQVNPVVTLADNAKRVVTKLGSPDTYHKYQWIYSGMNQNFLRSTYSNSGFDLVITFNDDYEVIGYEFLAK